MPLLGWSDAQSEEPIRGAISKCRNDMGAANYSLGQLVIRSPDDAKLTDSAGLTS